MEPCKKSTIDFAKAHRVSSSVALQVLKKNPIQFHSLNSLWSERQDTPIPLSYWNGDLNIFLERGYLVELIGEGLDLCMKWIISEYVHYVTIPNSCGSFHPIIYIDTCASLSVVKWNEHWKQHSLFQQHPKWIQQFWNDYFYYYRVVDAYEFMALLKSLHSFLHLNSSSWIIIVDNFTYQLEPFECRGNLLALFLDECYRLTKLYNTITFLITNTSSSSLSSNQIGVVSPIERYSSFLDIRLYLPETSSNHIPNGLKIIKSPYPICSNNPESFVPQGKRRP